MHNTCFYGLSLHNVMVYPGLFIGSSQITKWNLPKETIVKRARVSRELSAVRLPQHASRIVVYCGSNDILHGIDPTENLLRFVERLCNTYPRSEIVVLAILLSPFAKPYHEVICRVNARNRRGLPSSVYYVNMNRTLIHPKYYQDDALHLYQ